MTPKARFYVPDRVKHHTSPWDLTALLNGVPGLGALVAEGAGAWEAAVSEAIESVAAAVAARLVAAGKPIYQLAPVQRDLETVFREVSEATAEVPHAA